MAIDWLMLFTFAALVYFVMSGPGGPGWPPDGI